MGQPAREEAAVMKAARALSLVVMLVASPPAIVAQTSHSSSTDVTVLVTEARAANDALMRQYTWISRTEMIDQGQVKDVRIEAVTYGSEGRLQRSALNDPAAPFPRGFLRWHVAEHERQKVEEYVAGLRSLLEDYTLPRAGQVQNFINTTTASGPDSGGLVKLTGRNVVLPGDTFAVWIDPTTRHGQKVQVSTSFDGDIVTLTATFKTLPSGLNHVAYAEVTVPTRRISIQVQNFDYDRIN
jgi:hypothetical protein